MKAILDHRKILEEIDSVLKDTPEMLIYDDSKPTYTNREVKKIHRGLVDIWGAVHCALETDRHRCCSNCLNKYETKKQPLRCSSEAMDRVEEGRFTY